MFKSVKRDNNVQFISDELKSQKPLMEKKGGSSSQEETMYLYKEMIYVDT